MSASLSAERDRIQRQVEELEQCLSVTQTELELLSSETDDGSDVEDVEGEGGQSAAGLLAQKEKIQKEIQNLENVLGPQNPTCVSDDDGSSSSSSDESECGLSVSVDSCLQMNLVYQQVVQESLDQLETLMTQNHKQQRELVSQLSGPIKYSSREQPINLYLGRFLKPYFKDKLTGLGPPANQEAKEKSSRMTGCLEDRKLKMKRWESWQKTLLIHSVSRDSLKKLIQPKLSKVDYLSQKLSSAVEADRQQLREQIDRLEREIDLLREKKEEELIGDRYEEHDWQKISNVDFEGTRDAEDIRRFWQNFLHPSINKTRWNQEEVQRLKEVSRRHGERHWEAIAQELGTGRTAFMCLQMFQRFVSDSLRHSTWTPAEDTLLRELVEKMRIGNFIPYTQMSYFMEGRDPTQLIYRWNQVLDPSLKKGPWTKEEDQLLLQAVSRQGERNWWKIRLEVPGRTISACRDRYHDCLKVGTKRGPFDKQETDLLLQLVEKHGVGRWAKIAAELPHRIDSQCMREWRRLIRLLIPQKKRGRKPSTKSGGDLKTKVATVKRSIKKRLMVVKEEETSEEEDMVVQYMDSDEEEKVTATMVAEVETAEAAKEEEEEEYTIPPMQEWVPATEKPKCFTFLSFRPVVLPSPGDTGTGKHVRSTILGKFGRSVIIGPSPRALRWEERHSSGTMMMVSPDQLRAHLSHLAHKFNNQSVRPQRKVRPGSQVRLGRVTDMGIEYELQATLTPWIGNVLIPAKPRLTASDALRVWAEKTTLTSTPIFLLLLQAMNVDTMGCKEIITQRKNKVVLLTPPPDPSHVKMKDPKTVAGMLQQRQMMKEQQKLQDSVVMKQLQDLQQEKQKQQQLLHKNPVRPQQLQKLVLLQPLQSRPLLRPASTTQDHPCLVLQVPPNRSPHTSSPSFPQSVVIPHPAKQPDAASIRFVPPPSPTAPQRTPPAGRVTLPSPAPSVSVVPMRHSVRPTCSQQAVPLTQNLKEAPPPSFNQAVSVGSTLRASPSTSRTTAASPSQPSPPPSPLSTTPDPPGGRGTTEAGDQEAACSENSVADKYVDGAGDRVNQKPSQKARAEEEATKTEAETKTTAQSRVNTPSCSDRGAPPPVLTSQHTASSTDCPPAPLFSDHDYHLFHPIPAPSQCGSDLGQPSPAPEHPKAMHTESDSAPSKTPRGRKRGRAKEEQCVTSSQDAQCDGATGPGVIQEGKRVRKQSQKAKALQEAAQAKAEAKKKRSSTCSPKQKRSRRSPLKEEVSAQTQPATQIPGLHLLHGQSMWVMTNTGLVQLAQAPPQGLQVMFVSPDPGSVAPKTPAVVPVNPPSLNQPCRLPAPPTCNSKPLPPLFVQPPVPDPGPSSLPSCPSQPPPKIFLPYKGTVRVDPAKPPPLRKEALQFNPSLMFTEPREEVCDWLSGRGGVMVPGAGMALPYLPPFVSNLRKLSGLLKAKKSLTASSLQLLCRGSEPRHPRANLKPDGSTENGSTRPPPHLPDSTLDLRPAGEQPAASVTSSPLQQQQQQQEEEEREEELVAAVRHLVAERFSSNPAYQLLKARFLSCFTVPALLATMEPIPKDPVACPANQEGKEDEEEAELMSIKERGRQRRVERSSLLCDSSGAPANHFSGIISDTRPDQTSRNQITDVQ